MKKESKFVKEGKEIFYIDKWGRQWDKSCIDDIFDTLKKRQDVNFGLDYYSYSEL